ncbi:cell division protein ZapA [Halomonas urumqiensis]|uniref:Cell division protein ZapA n=1 Tax=Halomonas urumqiensis TaxID=1684789 RepID=A0A2N7UK57_9GAMM|nr:cell division protein ZapA [Halomonas urumqiensis]PMR80821.1 cell division protein ZapA [Halomonas urumqiensis]PTB02778.1 cell division protein ZapA [Halomonas urumqiensis]GHE21281.1 cell division protein ZapA [Halomonas urumqiensis]
MTDASRPTTEISLLGRYYVIACPPDEQDKLERAARYLDKAMNGIHAQNNLLGSERIAIMAALNITHELLETLDAQRDSERSLDALSSRLEAALADTPPR